MKRGGDNPVSASLRLFTVLVRSVTVRLAAYLQQAPLARLGARVAGVAGVTSRNLLLDAALHHAAAGDLLLRPWTHLTTHRVASKVGLLLDAAGVGLSVFWCGTHLQTVTL